MKGFKEVFDNFVRFIYSLESKDVVIESLVLAFNECGKSGAKLHKIKDIISEDMSAGKKLKVISKIIDMEL